MKDHLLILFEDAINIEAVDPLELVCRCGWVEGAERAVLVPLIVQLFSLLDPLILLLLVRLVEPLGSEAATLVGHPLLGRGRCCRTLFWERIFQRRHFLQTLSVVLWRVI
jgi:hypothetical protein